MGKNSNSSQLNKISQDIQEILVSLRDIQHSTKYLQEAGIPNADARSIKSNPYRSSYVEPDTTKVKDLATSNDILTKDLALAGSINHSLLTHNFQLLEELKCLNSKHTTIILLYTCFYFAILGYVVVSLREHHISFYDRLTNSHLITTIFLVSLTALLVVPILFYVKQISLLLERYAHHFDIEKRSGYPMSPPDE
jgi:hypothetical protein